VIVTKNKYKEIRFTGGMKLIYKGKVFDIVSADFGEYTFGIEIKDELIFVPCKDVELLETT